MKTKRFFTSATALLIALMITGASSFVFASAQSNVQITLSSAKIWSSAQQSYVAAGDLSPGDTGFIAVNSGSTSNIGGILLSVAYDTNTFTFKDGASFTTISDNSGKLDFYNTSGKVNVSWDTTKLGTAASGDIFYLCFVVNESTTVSTSAKFSLSVSSLYDSSDSQNDIPFTVGNSEVTVNIVSTELPESTLGIFRNLLTITYPGSLADITAADLAYAGMTLSQQKNLYNNHSDLYTAYQDAKTTYNRLAAAAAQELVLQEVESFMTGNSQVLSLTTDTITIDDNAALTKAELDLSNLSSPAKSRISAETKNHIVDLRSAVNNLEEALLEIEESKAEMSSYFVDYAEVIDLSNDVLISDYTSYYSQIDIAVMIYGTLSDYAQQGLVNEYNNLLNKQKICDGLIKQDVAEAATKQKVNEFQQQFLYVFTLNSSNVSLADESAIKMVQQAYEKLDDNVKAKLNTRISKLDSLLSIITSLKQSSDDGNNSHKTSSSEVETTQITPQTITKTITDTITDTITKLMYTDKGVTKVIFWLICLWGASVLTFIFPLVIRLRLKKEENSNDKIMESI